MTPSERLPLSVKLCFGAPGFAGAGLALPIAIHLPQFYSDVVLVPLGYVALVIAVARAFDALNDPFIGWLSDRTRTRWGRRKPYIVAAVPLSALVFWMLFAPPVSLSPLGATLWFAGTFWLFYQVQSFYLVPHAALGAELTYDYHERSRLFAIQGLFTQLGVLTAAVLPVVLVGVLGRGQERMAYSSMAAFFGLVLIVLYALLLWKVPERASAARAPSPLVPGVRRALRNRPFRILFLAGAVQAIPAALPPVLARYHVFYVLRPENPELWLGVCLMASVVSTLAFIPAWMWVARRYGKLPSFAAGSVIGIVASPLFFFADQGDLLFTAGILCVLGVAQAAGIFLVPAMGADVIDYDELLTGQRREAQFNSLWTIIPKFLAIPGASVPIAVLAGVGYVPNQVQSAEVVLAIKCLLGVVPVGFHVAALVLVLRYPITETIHRQVRAAVVARARGETVRDPLTGASLAPTSSVPEDVGWFLDHFSLRELRHCIDRAPWLVVRDVAVAVGISFSVLVTASWITIHRASDVSSEPSFWVMLAVVIAGLAFTALIFHALRLASAWRLTRSPLDPRLVDLHMHQVGAIEQAASRPPAAEP